MMYRGEYYRMQCDAHMEFVKHWVSELCYCACVLYSITSILCICIITGHLINHLLSHLLHIVG